MSDTVQINKQAFEDIIHAMKVIIDIMETKYLSPEEERRYLYVCRLIETSTELIKSQK